MKEKYWAILGIGLLAVGGLEIYWLTHGSREAPPPPVRPAEYVPHLEPGEVAPAFEARTFDGSGKERVDYPEKGKKTFVFVMSLTCGICTRTVPHWNRIVEQTRGSARTLGIVIGSYEREQELLKEKGLTFPALRFPDPQTQALYKVTKLPQTLLIGPGGRVEQAIVGELGEPQITDLIARVNSGGTGAVSPSAAGDSPAPSATGVGPRRPNKQP